MKRFRAIIVLVILVLSSLSAPARVSAADCQLTMGFATLRDLVALAEGADRIGECGEQARYDAAGNSTQPTTGGLMVWRKADNWTGFTDGHHTWVNGPNGLQVRLNTQRLPWEHLVQDLLGAFRDAVNDAEVAEPGEISTNLTSIVESNDRLVWQGVPANRQVLAVTWTNWPGYDDFIGQTTTAGVDTWVTAVPDLQDFCQTEKPAEPVLRLEELLGLPPGNGKNRFVEIWVSPRDLFRPSPDPEVTDHEAQLDFPDSRFVTISDQYKAWFNDLKSKSYGENGYPWTRLGYSYDWGNPSSHIGLSEFVIPKGSPIEISSVVSNEEYCR